MQNMLSILANWAQIIAVFLTIVAILIEVQQRRIRTQIRAVGIGFHPIWSPVLIRADEDHRDKIEIRYAGRNVSNMFILQAVVRNTGDLPIRRSHIVQPIRFTFRPEVELLNKPRIVNKNPENLMINWDFSKINSASEQSVSLDFDLLNPNEELTVEFIGVGQASQPKVTARIEGITTLESFDPLYSLEESNRYLTSILTRAIFWGLIAALLVNIALLTRLTTETQVHLIDYFSGLGTGFILAGVVGYISQQILLWWTTRRNYVNRKKTIGFR